MDSKLYSIWEQRQAKHESSGKSVATWCKEQTVKENQFYYSYPIHEQGLFFSGAGIAGTKAIKASQDWAGLDV